MRLSRAYSSLSDAIPLTKAKYVPSSGTYPKGFKAAGVFAGVKPGSSKPDLALVTSDRPCSAAAVFTKSLFKAPPVNFTRELLERRANAGLRSVIINSGNANSVTGIGGLQDTSSMARTTDQSIGAEDSTLVMSTGVIGQRLPIQKILNQIPTAYRQAGDSHENWINCAKAICTTDTFPKLMSRTFELPSSPGIEYRIVGLTKGAGMISPNMATLLAIMATDAPVSPTIMTSLLRHATDRSFNSISVDNDPSSNDTVALLANGAAGGQEVTSARSSDHEHFGAVLTDFSADLAKYIVRDGEGATKFVTIRVVDAATEEGARQVARTVALSSLVKTALYGQDANWGRIVVAAGHALITPPTHAPREVQDIVPEKTSVSFVPADGSAELKLLVNGEPEQVDEARAREILEMEDLEILLRLGTGNQSSTHWTCDLSHGYVTINGDYRT